ncbi:MAG TPA: myo-inosose-2 dehydratase [Steroidobacteraceae bacterium]|nr:myo-inosose-2 dehydratase [Steroidobacteraceae bacterium]
MSVRLGANPIIWSNDDMRELGADISLDTCLAQARDIGFRGMELGHKFPRDAAALAEVLGRFGLQCISGWYSAELLVWGAAEELTRLRPHLELLKALECPVLVLAEVSGAVHGDRNRPLSDRPVLMARDWRELGARLTELAASTAAEGVRLAYHHHMGTVVQSEADIDALMQSTGPEVGLLLDTGHAAFAGADPAALARRYAPRIVHVHAKDVRAAVCTQARSANWSFLDAVLKGVFTVPGDGSVDFASVFDPLRGYSGWVVLEAEQDPRIADPLRYATLGYRNLRHLLAGRLA